VLKSQDILVLLKLAAKPPAWTFDSIAHELGLSQSSVHRSLGRAHAAGLYDPRRREVRAKALFEFLVHGLKYVFPASWGGEARGYRTAWAAKPLSAEIVSGGSPPVWPDAHGDAWGIALEPIHPSVPGAAREDPELAELLALVDALRIGGARERNLARNELKKRLRA
jgi:hypothetical protein